MCLLGCFRCEKNIYPIPPLFKTYEIYFGTTTRYTCKSYLRTSNIIICIKINLRLSLQTHTPSTDQLNVFTSSALSDPSQWTMAFTRVQKKTNKQFTKCTLCHTALSGSHSSKAPDKRSKQTSIYILSPQIAYILTVYVLNRSTQVGCI